MLCWSESLYKILTSYTYSYAFIQMNYLEKWWENQIESLRCLVRYQRCVKTEIENIRRGSICQWYFPSVWLIFSQSIYSIITSIHCTSVTKSYDCSQKFIPILAKSFLLVPLTCHWHEKISIDKDKRSANDRINFWTFLRTFSVPAADFVSYMNSFKYQITVNGCLRWTKLNAKTKIFN